MRCSACRWRTVGASRSGCIARAITTMTSCARSCNGCRRWPPTASTCPSSCRARAARCSSVVSHPDVPEPRQVDLFAWIAGQPLGSVESGLEGDAETLASTFHTIGTLAARLHNHAARWRPRRRVHPPCLGCGRTGRRATAVGPVLGAGGALRRRTRAHGPRPRPGARRPVPSRALARATTGSSTPTSRPENLMVDGPRVRLIDFDDAGYGWHLFEIATSLYFHIGQPYFDRGRARDGRGLPRRARADGSGRGAACLSSTRRAASPISDGCTRGTRPRPRASSRRC